VAIDITKDFISIKSGNDITESDSRTSQTGKLYVQHYFTLRTLNVRVLIDKQESDNADVDKWRTYLKGTVTVDTVEYLCPGGLVVTYPFGYYEKVLEFKLVEKEA